MFARYRVFGLMFLALLSLTAMFVASRAAAFPAINAPSRYVYLPVVMATRAASPTPTVQPTRTTTPTITPTVGPSPTATPGPLFADDFSTTAHHWVAREDQVARFAYDNGEYQMRVKVDHLSSRSLAQDFACANGVIEVDGRFASGTYGAYGLLFGITDQWQGYLFAVTGDQRYALYRLDGAETKQALVDWTASAAIRAGQASNRLRVARIGNSIALTVNGQLLQTLTDSTYTGTWYVGLTAITLSTPDVDVRFDNFVVYP